MHCSLDWPCFDYRSTLQFLRTSPEWYKYRARVSYFNASVLSVSVRSAGNRRPTRLPARPKRGDLPSHAGSHWTAVLLKNESRLRLFVKIEAVKHVVGFGVSFGQRRQVKPVFCKFQKRRELILSVAYIAFFGVGRNDQQRHTGT